MGRQPIRLVVPGDGAGKRLDLFLASRLQDLSRNQVRHLIEGGHVHALSPSKPLKPSLVLKAAQVFEVVLPEPEPTHLVAQKIPLEVVFEDSHLLVIHKPVGMVVHPGAGNPDGTLVNAILAHCPDIDGIGGKRRPGLVHRLDKDTSGLIVIAKTGQAFKGLTRQIASRHMSREYVGIVMGELKGSGTVDAPVGRDVRNRVRMDVRAEAGKPAVTHFHALQEGKDASLVHFKLETGRTHQIRVHAAFIGHPMLGDAAYGGDTSLAERQMLHAFRLSFTHPGIKKEVTFTAPPPVDFLTCLAALGLGEPFWGGLVWERQAP
jgi:23S rRNA pseudouridine1911/1915/1917 synthase